jgi:hypothetical protein
MKSADNIKRLFKSAVVSTHSRRDNDVFRRVQTAYTSSRENRSAEQKPTLWRFAMKSPITKLAVAAVVVIACLIGLSFWRTTGSGIALADVLARMEQVRAVKFKWTYTMTGGDPDPNKPYRNFETRSTSLASGEYGTKDNWETLDLNGGKETFFQERYVLPQKKTFILINLQGKTYLRKELEDADVEQIQKENLGRDPLSLLKGILKTKYESLGRSTMDGIEVAGFRTTDPSLSVGKGENPQTDNKIWVDVKTLLPVRYDCLTSVEVNEWGERSNRIHHFVMHDFQWDVSVGPAEFEPPPIPDGYKVADQFPDLVNEETAIQGLKQCVELLGNYPERIAFSYLWSGFKKSETPAVLRLKEELKGLTELEKDYKKLDVLKPMRFLNKFYLGLASKDSAYYGKAVTPKDADKVLLRWKVSNSEYRVIYGDLHAETVTAEALTELEKALPK